MLVAELGAKLRGEAAPVARGVRLLSRDAGEDDVLQFVVVLEDITGEANGAVMLDVDALEVHTVLEGVGSERGDAGRQREAGHGVAVVESILADSGNTVADGDGGETLTTDEGEVADAGHTVTDGDAGEAVAPGCGGAPEAADGGVVVVVHRARAADGQHGVVAAVVLREAPCEAVAGGAADGLQGGADSNVGGADGDGGTLLVGSHLAAGSSRSGEGGDGLVGIVNGQRSCRTASKIGCVAVGQRGIGCSHGHAAGYAANGIERDRVGDIIAFADGCDTRTVGVVIAGFRIKDAISISFNSSRASTNEFSLIGCCRYGDVGKAFYHLGDMTARGGPQNAHDAAGVGFSLDGARHTAVSDLGVIACIAHNATSIAFGCATDIDVAILHDDVLQRADIIITGAFSIAEESGILVAAADGEAADGLVVTVIFTLKGFTASANGRPVAAERDGVSLLEVHVLVVRAAVHIGSQLVQVAGTGNQVRVGTGAATVPCPRRGRREQHHEQRQGCPHREMS